MSRALRRHQAQTHMMRRLKEDRNQHYDDLTCSCWTDAKAMARFKEQPKSCQHYACCNQRHNEWCNKIERLTMQERRHLAVTPACSLILPQAVDR